LPLNFVWSELLFLVVNEKMKLKLATMN